jgi:hypothetical protein
MSAMTGKNTIRAFDFSRLHALSFLMILLDKIVKSH